MILNMNFMILCIIKCCLWGKKQQPSSCLAAAIPSSFYIWLQNKQLDLLRKLVKAQLKVMACSSSKFERFNSSVGCDWKSAESDEAGLHTHTKTHQKNMLGMLTSTWHGIRFLYFTSFDSVSASGTESWGLTHFMSFTAEKDHNPLTKKYPSMNSLSLLFPSVLSLWPLWPLSMCFHVFTTGGCWRTQAMSTRLHLPGATEEGQVNGDVSHSLSATAFVQRSFVYWSHVQHTKTGKGWWAFVPGS